MRNTPGIGFRDNNAVIRLKDRRVLIGKTKAGFRIEAHKIDKGRYWKTSHSKRLHNALVVTSISFSEEAMMGILQAVIELTKRAKYNTKER
jgi:hypothetical protein